MSVTVEPWTTPELRDQAVDLLRRLVARDPVTLACIALPGTTSEELERELRSVGDGEYELEVTPPQGGSTSELDTPLHHAIEAFLAGMIPRLAWFPLLAWTATE